MSRTFWAAFGISLVVLAAAFIYSGALLDISSGKALTWTSYLYLLYDPYKYAVEKMRSAMPDIDAVVNVATNSNLLVERIGSQQSGAHIVFRRPDTQKVVATLTREFLAASGNTTGNLAICTVKGAPSVRVEVGSTGTVSRGINVNYQLFNVACTGQSSDLCTKLNSALRGALSILSGGGAPLPTGGAGSPIINVIFGDVNSGNLGHITCLDPNPAYGPSSCTITIPPDILNRLAEEPGSDTSEFISLFIHEFLHAFGLEHSEGSGDAIGSVNTGITTLSEDIKRFLADAKDGKIEVENCNPCESRPPFDKKYYDPSTNQCVSACPELGKYSSANKICKSCPRGTSFYLGFCLCSNGEPIDPDSGETCGPVGGGGGDGWLGGQWGQCFGPTTECERVFEGGKDTGSQNCVTTYCDGSTCSYSIGRNGDIEYDDDCSSGPSLFLW